MSIKLVMSGNKTEDPSVTNKQRRDWNDFLLHLEKIKMRGNAALDKNNLGYKVFDEYVKNNPGTSLTRETIPIIRKELLNYRSWALQQNKSTVPGSAKLAQGVTEDMFMRHVLENEKTKIPDYPGVNLTQTSFPDSYLVTFENGKKINTENKGFAQMKKP